MPGADDATGRAGRGPHISEEQRERARRMYEDFVGRMNDDDVRRAASEGAGKLRRLSGAIPDALRDLWTDIGDLIDLLEDHVRGRYRTVPVKALAAMAAAVLYLVMPLDAIPDFIPGVGYLDDATVIAICLRMVRSDLEAYRRWRGGSEAEVDPDS